MNAARIQAGWILRDWASPAHTPPSWRPLRLRVTSLSGRSIWKVAIGRPFSVLAASDTRRDGPDEGPGYHGPVSSITGPRGLTRSGRLGGLAAGQPAGRGAEQPADA